MVDPLVLDLDGDGLEITPLSRGVQFDGNGDTIRTNTSWVQADDGLLVLDRNGNGVIDSGRELFGDETLLADGTKAAHGFAALAELDVGGAANATGGAGDGVFDAKDAQYTNVRIWRDLNQDGISQAGEMQTLQDAGITSIKLESTATSTSYGDAQLVQSGSFTRADGSEGQAGSFILAQNNAETTHAPITVSAEAQALPAIEGSGWVRDLPQAATVSPELVGTYNQMAQAAPVRSDYIEGVGRLLLDWAGKSGYDSASRQAVAAGHGLIMSEPANEEERGWMDMAVKASEAGREAFRAGLGEGARTRFDAMRERMVGDLDKLHAYEAFTGHTFVTWERVWLDATGQLPNLSGPPPGSVPVVVDVPLSQIIMDNRIATESTQPGYVVMRLPSSSFSPLSYIDMLWQRIVQDAASNLMPVVRLPQYLDLVDLVVTDSGVGFDFARLNAALEAGSAADAHEGAALFLDMYRTYGEVLNRAGWNGVEKMQSLMLQAADNQDIEDAFTAIGHQFFTVPSTKGSVNDDIFVGNASVNSFNGDKGNDFISGAAGDDSLNGGLGDDFVIGGDGNDTVYGEDGNDTLRGGADSDYLYGGAGNDILEGETGADYLYGGVGDDTLDGGAGNDVLSGDTGNDTYLFGRGDGQDSISYDYNLALAGKHNVLRFKAGVSASDVNVTRSGSSLVLAIRGTSDSISVSHFFNENTPLNTWNPVQEVVFEDGTAWNMQALVAMTLQGTEGSDTLTGTDGADNLLGLGGNDQVSGGKGDDTLDGGEGNDYLYGEAGNDTLLGGAGADYLYGGAGDDTLDGGAGNDVLSGDTGNDTYLFGRGDGQDTINYDNGPLEGKHNVLRFKAGVSAGDVIVTRSGGSLVLAIRGTTDQVGISHFFSDNTPLNTWNPIQEVVFEDGTSWSQQALVMMTMQGTEGSDMLTGSDGADNFNGLGGNDQLWGGKGDDTLNGGDGNDYLYGEAGNDTLLGGAGADYLYGGVGDDTLDGGAGNDVLSGDMGNDTYLFGRGDGQDSINYDYNLALAGKHNVLRFKAGVSASDVTVTRSGSTLVLSINDSSDKISVSHFFYDNPPLNTWNPVQEVVFEDGTAWNMQALVDMTLQGTEGSDTLTGTDGADNMLGLGGNDQVSGGKGDDTLDGGEGNDYLYGEAGNDTLLGGAGADYLYGGVGDDTLDGGAGNDVLSGDTGNDTYLFGRGDGQDSISYDYNLALAGKHNVLRFKAGVSASDVNVTRSGSSLVLAIRGTTDQMSISHFFNENTPLNTWNPVQEVVFEDGTAWNMQALVDMTLQGTEGSDTLTGTDGADNLLGLGGNDQVSGGKGDDTLDGGEGNDYLYGEAGNDTLLGGAGADYLYGGVGDDTLDGGAGNDVLSGDTGNDTYLFGRGDGQDSISYDYNLALEGKHNVLRFKAGVSASDVKATRSGSALVLSIRDTSDSISVSHFFNENTPLNTWNPVQEVVFEDGTAWNMQALVAMTLQGTEGSDTLTGTDGADNLLGLGGNDQVSGGKGDDTLDGGEGNDYLYGEAGNDTLLGGAGADYLYGGAGDDTLDGGAGNDVLSGDTGNDTYLFGRGAGADVVTDYDTASGNTDVLSIGGAVAADQLWFCQVGSSLEVSIIGTSDKTTISNWYSGSSYHIEQFKTANGKVLLSSQVNALVSAMAAFAPPPAGQTSLAADYQTALAPVLAASWN